MGKAGWTVVLLFTCSACATNTTKIESCGPAILITGPVVNSDGIVNIDFMHIQPGIKCKF